MFAMRYDIRDFSRFLGAMRKWIKQVSAKIESQDLERRHSWGLEQLLRELNCGLLADVQQRPA